MIKFLDFYFCTIHGLILLFTLLNNTLKIILKTINILLNHQKFDLINVNFFFTINFASNKNCPQLSVV